MAADSIDSMEELRKTVRTCPIIDNHAHNLLRPHQLKHHNLLTITTEAEGAALEDAPKSLAHLRASRQLCRLYELPLGAEWDTILNKRKELLDRDADALVERCLEGTHTILIDDGLGDNSTVEPYSWHNKYTTSPCKRIVRIEAIAAEILSSLHQQGRLPVGVAIADEEACSVAWVTFLNTFEESIAVALANSEVAGFKSVICYRTGLDVQLGRDKDVTEAGLASFRRHYLPNCSAKNFRVAQKAMNDALVISVCKLIDSSYRTNRFTKPFQFHTGLGDNDMSLLGANPACLQPLIAAYPHVPIVLLHSSYPFTRESGYLASVYKNAYLDIGEVFPMISRDGQEQVVRQAMELAPISKILWSTDGHYFPETYWLANVQGRDALEKVLCEYVVAKDLTLKQAVDAARDILFRNSNALYDLRLSLPGSESLPLQMKSAAHDVSTF